MYSEDSARYMAAAIERQTAWIPPSASKVIRDLSPLPRQAAWDMCAFYYHEQILGDGYCAACRFQYGGHFEGYLRGARLLYPARLDLQKDNPDLEVNLRTIAERGAARTRGVVYGALARLGVLEALTGSSSSRVAKAHKELDHLLQILTLQVGHER